MNDKDQPVVANGTTVGKHCVPSSWIRRSIRAACWIVLWKWRNQLDQYAMMLRTLCKSMKTLESCFPEVVVKLNQPITSLGIRVRTLHALESEGINAVAELVARTENQLRQIRDVGDLAMTEISDGLSRLGVKLRSI